MADVPPLQLRTEDLDVSSADELSNWDHRLVRTVLNTAPCLIIVLDRDGRIVRFNRTCCELTGYTFDEVRGRRVWEFLLPPEQIERVGAVFQSLVSEPPGAVDFSAYPHAYENEWLTRKSDRRLILWSNDAIRNARGEVTAVMGTGLDITDRKELQRRLAVVRTQEQRRLARDLHDDIGGELTGLRLLAATLQGQLEREGSPSVGRLTALVERIDAAHRRVRAVSQDLSPVEDVPEGLVTALHRLAEQCETTHGVPCRVVSDPPVQIGDGTLAIHLFRIAQEAVTNALRHGKAREIRLELVRDDRGVRLEIADNGTGLSPRPSRPRGFGLSAMRQRARELSGELTVQPRREGGTRVTCLIPG